MMEFIVKEHNRIAYKKAVEAFKTSRKTCCVHATGTGKAYIALQFIRDAKCKVVYVTSYAANLAAFRDNVFKYFGDKVNDVEFLIYSNLKQFNDTDEHAAGLIILDEMHRAGADGWEQQVNILLDSNPDAKVLGLTATAIRYLDDERDMSKDLFDGNVCSEINLVDAIAGGILKAPSYYCCVYSFKDEIAAAEAILQENKLNKEKEDKARSLLNKAKRLLEESNGLPEFFDEYMKNKSGKYIVFCSNSEHLAKMKEESAEWFPGIDTKIYTMLAANDDSMEQLKQFESNTSDCLRLLFCVSMLNEGVHVNGIDGVIMLRPTSSLNVYFQQLGRCLSTGAGEHPAVFDIVNNSATLKPVRKMMGEISNLNSNGGKSIPDFVVFGRDEDIIDCLNEFYDITFNYRLWTEYEDNLIRQLFFNDRARLVRLLKNRNKKSIMHRANLLGLKGCPKNEYWTEEEENILKEFYQNEGTKVASRLNGRSITSIRAKAEHLGLVYSRNIWTDEECDILRKYYPKEGYKVALRLNGRGERSIAKKVSKLGLKYFGRDWTDEEDNILKKYYTLEGIKVISRLDNKKKTNVRSRAKLLGLNYAPKWTSDEDSIMRKYYPSEGGKVVSRLNGRTHVAVNARARILGIKNR